MALPTTRCDCPVAPPRPADGATRYKGVGRSGEAIFGGRARWPLPEDDGPGAWMPVAAPRPGVAGYHLCSASDLLRCWLAPRLFVAEGRGAVAAAPGGAVFAEARLVRELPWDVHAGRWLYRDCLSFTVAQARPRGDFVAEAHHRRCLADACLWEPDARWYDAVRLGLAELAVALGDVWYRDERRRCAPGPLPRRACIARAQDWQVRRFLRALGVEVASAAARESVACA